MREDYDTYQPKRLTYEPLSHQDRGPVEQLQAQRDYLMRQAIRCGVPLLWLENTCGTCLVRYCTQQGDCERWKGLTDD